MGRQYDDHLGVDHNARRLRSAMRSPDRMAEVVSELVHDLVPSDYGHVKALLVLLTSAARISRTRHGDAPGSSHRVLLDGIHRVRWRVGRAVRDGECHLPLPGDPLSPSTVNGWAIYHGSLEEQELDDILENQMRPLTFMGMVGIVKDRNMRRAARDFAREGRHA